LDLQQIEPALLEAPATGPLNLTQGLEYEGYSGYGTLYLDLLRMMTSIDGD